MNTKAAFKLEDFIIPQFSFNNLRKDESFISLRFNPSGIYIPKEKKFVLKIEFKGFYSDEKENDLVEIENDDVLIKAVIEADFLFTEIINFNDLPEYFFQNSIAIVFPYIRAFVTSLTCMANVKPLILPTLNLTALATPLKNNSKVL